MAQLDDAALVVCLGLKEADALGQLVGHRRLLVVPWRSAYECGIVGADKRDVAIYSIAELAVPVAECGGSAMGRCSGKDAQMCPAHLVPAI